MLLGTGDLNLQCATPRGLHQRADDLPLVRESDLPTAPNVFFRAETAIPACRTHDTVA